MTETSALPVSPLAPFEGGYPIPGFDLERRWFDARQLTAQERDEVLDLLRAAFNGKPSWFALPVTPEDHFDWKYRDSPLGTTATCSVDADGHIIGFIGRIRRTWLVEGRPYVVRFGSDHCQLPEWQGRGLQRAIALHRDDEWHPSENCVLGEFDHPANFHLAKERGNRAPANRAHDYVYLLHQLRRARRLTHPSERVRAKPLPPAETVSKTAAVIRSEERRRGDRLRERIRLSLRVARSLLRRRRAERDVAWSISSIAAFELQDESFLTEALGQFDFVGERSVDYLNWRFCDERAGPFTVRVARQDGQLLGYSVLRVLEESAYISDILARPGRSDVAESLIRDGVALAQSAGAASVRIRLPRHHPYRRALQRAGFFDVGPIAGELIDMRDPTDPALDFLRRDDARIHYTFSDRDTP